MHLFDFSIAKIISISEYIIIIELGKSKEVNKDICIHFVPANIFS